MSGTIILISLLFLVTLFIPASVYLFHSCCSILFCSSHFITSWRTVSLLFNLYFSTSLSYSLSCYFLPFLYPRPVILFQSFPFLSLHYLTPFPVNGTASEGMSMTVPERKQVAEAWLACRGDISTVIVQCGAGCLKDTQDLVSKQGFRWPFFGSVVLPGFFCLFPGVYACLVSEL